MAYFDEELGVVGSNPAYGTTIFMPMLFPRQSVSQVDNWQGKCSSCAFLGKPLR